MEKDNLAAHWLAVIFGSLHGLTFNQWVSLGVLVTGFITMLINWYYKHKHLELAQQPHQQHSKGVNSND